MQIKKGKVLFGFKDTFSMDSVLAEVICAGVTKYKEVISEKNRKGIPSSIYDEVELTVNDEHEDFEGLCYKRLDYVLDEIIYAFGDNAPDIMKYDYDYDEVSNTPDQFGNKTYSLVCNNKEELLRYETDSSTHDKRCEEGRLLFAKHFDGLWW